jgi:hypothetical protein
MCPSMFHYPDAEPSNQESTHLPQVLSSKNLLHDAYQMLNAFMEPIHSHALQVYYSPAATMPDCALLGSAQYKSLATNALLLSSEVIDWGPELQQPVTAIPRRLSERASGWSKNLAIIGGHDDAGMSVALSPNGEQIVSRFSDGTVRIWHVDTGVELHEHRGRSDRVC